MNDYSIVILNAETIQTLPIAEALYKKGYKVILFCETKNSYGYHTRYATNRVLCPEVKDSPSKFHLFLLNYLDNNKVDVILPMNDYSAEYLSKNKDELLKKCKFNIPNYDIFCNGYNKNNLMRLCNECSIPHPMTLDLERSSTEQIKTMIYPALIKPNITCGGRGMTPVNNYEEFIDKYPSINKQYGECHLQQFIEPGGKQIEVQLFISQKQELLYSSVMAKDRWYPEKGGSSCCNLSIINDQLVNTCFEICKKLKWHGFCDFDTIEDVKNGDIKILEINPRVPACVRGVMLSGIDYANIQVNDILNIPQEKNLYAPGIRLRFLGFEVLWFLGSSQRFKTKPNWFSFFNKNIYYQDFILHDPLPFIFGTLGNIKKLFNSKFKESKSGMK